MKKIILLVAISLFSHANSSGIQINRVQGGANFGSGTINNNHFDAQLKINNQNITYTRNITNILQQNPTLLKDIRRDLKRGFISVTTLMQNHRSTLNSILKLYNTTSSQQQKIIVKQNQLIFGQKKLLDGQGRLFNGQGKLVNGQGKILYNQEIIVDKQGKIYNMQGQILSNQAHLVNNQGYIINGIGDLMGGQIEIQKTLKNINNFINKIDKPNIIHDINWNLNSFCQEHNIKYIDEITFNMSKFNATNTLDYKHELEKINCLKTLYSKSRQQKYELHVFGSNANDTYKVVEAIKLYGEIDEQNIFQQANYHQNNRLVYVKQVAR